MNDAPILRPRALKPGDTVGLITPSSYFADPDRLYQVEQIMKWLDLKVKMGRNVTRKHGYLGGTIEERAADFNAAFADPEVKAVFALRGGYGASQILDRIDYDLVRRNPKILLGYSDITALHLAVHQKTGLVTFHGPTAASRMSDYTAENLKKALFSPAPLGKLANPAESSVLRPQHMTRAIRPGKARGRLIGGNLTLISTTMGTPYEIQTKGKLLFLEDVDEQPYSMDRMLTQLRLAGKLDGIAGLIFGECSSCRPRDFKPSFESTFSTAEVAQQILGGLKAPVLTGLTIGHTEDQLTLPLGVMATLNADDGTITIEEAATQ